MSLILVMTYSFSQLDLFCEGEVSLLRYFSNGLSQRKVGLNLTKEGTENVRKVLLCALMNALSYSFCWLVADSVSHSTVTGQMQICLGTE